MQESIPKMVNKHALIIIMITTKVMPILEREFENDEEEMKKIVLKVVKQCV